jgi:hypothetical protein
MILPLNPNTGHPPSSDPCAASPVAGMAAVTCADCTPAPIAGGTAGDGLGP